MKSTHSAIKLSLGYSVGYEFTKGHKELPTIVLLNGSLFNYHQWDTFLKWGLLPKVRGKFRVLRYDYGGTGRSINGLVDWDLHKLVDELAELLDGLGIERVHLFGISKGTILGQLFSARYPERVLSLSGYGWFHFDYSQMERVTAFFASRLRHFNYLASWAATPMTKSEFSSIWDDITRYLRTLFRSNKLPRWLNLLIHTLLKRSMYKLLTPTPPRVMYDWFAYAVKMMPKAGSEFNGSYEKIAVLPIQIHQAVSDGTLPVQMAREFQERVPSSELIEYGRGYNHISPTVYPRHAAAISTKYVAFLKRISG